MSNLEDRVKKEIEKTGLTTEIKVTKILKDNDWSVHNEYPYLDAEENKIRLLDIKAVKYILTPNESDNSSTSKSSCELYIECKKSTKQSWVFYTETVPYSYLELTLDKLVAESFGKVFNASIESEKNAQINIFTRIPTKFKKLDYRVALSHKTIFGEKDDFYNAQMQILKALHHEASLEEITKEMTIIPIIIFDGNLFECNYKLNELHVTKTNYTRYLSYGLPSQEIPALIDVVALEHFPKYIKMIEKEFHLSSSN